MLPPELRTRVPARNAAIVNDPENTGSRPRIHGARQETGDGRFYTRTVAPILSGPRPLKIEQVSSRTLRDSQALSVHHDLTSLACGPLLNCSRLHIRARGYGVHVRKARGLPESCGFRG